MLQPATAPFVDLAGTSRNAIQKDRLTPTEVFAFFIGVTGFIQLSLVGTLFAPDVLLFFVLLYLLAKRGSSLTAKWPARVIVFGLVWLGSQVATDMFRGSDSEDYLRGWAKIVFLLTNFAALYLLTRTDRRLLAYIVGIAVSQIARYFINPPEAAADDPWKWSFGFPVTLLAAVISGILWNNRKTLALGVLGCACALNIFFNFRSMALFCFATLCCLLLTTRKKGRQNLLKLLPALITLAVCGWSFGKLYESLAMSGALGRAALEKYEIQSQGDMGVLLGGRGESFASLEAIKDSPFLGHGSWARDAYYVNLLKSTEKEHGYQVSHSTRDVIPSHSHIAGAWVEAGVLGALFWLVIFVLVLRGMLAVLSDSRVPSRVLTIFCGVVMLWNIPFSPFGAEGRFMTPAFMLLMIYAVKRAGALRRRPLTNSYRPTNPFGEFAESSGMRTFERWQSGQSL
jgi:O-antigen ligase